MSHWCKAEQIHFHMDGARLSGVGLCYQKFGKPMSVNYSISVYVSMYKGLGAIGGAILAGEPDFIRFV